MARQVADSVVCSPEIARARLNDFIDNAPDLQSYEDFADAVYVRHELPLAMYSLYKLFGAPVSVPDEDGIATTDGFFRQKGLSQIKGRVFRHSDGMVTGPQQIDIVQARARVLRSPRELSRAQLTVTGDFTRAQADCVDDHQTGVSVTFADYETRFGMRLQNQGADMATLDRLYLTVSPERAALALGLASTTLCKLSRGLLSVTEFEAI